MSHPVGMLSPDSCLSTSEKVGLTAVLLLLISALVLLLYAAQGRTPWEAYRLSRARRGISLLPWRPAPPAPLFHLPTLSGLLL